MTGVGLTKNKKEPIIVKNENDPMLNDINNQINAILKNIDDEGEDEKVRKTIKHLKDSADFQKLVKEIDDYRDEIHEEFDEVKYLIKFADNTHKLIDRHKNVMTNIFRGAGLRLFRKNLEGWKHPIFYGSFRFIMEGPFHKKLDRKQKKKIKINKIEII